MYDSEWCRKFQRGREIAKDLPCPRLAGVAVADKNIKLLEIPWRANKRTYLYVECRCRNCCKL